MSNIDVNQTKHPVFSKGLKANPFKVVRFPISDTNEADGTGTPIGYVEFGGDKIPLFRAAVDVHTSEDGIQHRVGNSPETELDTLIYDMKFWETNQSNFELAKKKIEEQTKLIKENGGFRKNFTQIAKLFSENEDILSPILLSELPRIVVVCKLHSEDLKEVCKKGFSAMGYSKKQRSASNFMNTDLMEYAIPVVKPVSVIDKDVISKFFMIISEGVATSDKELFASIGLERHNYKDYVKVTGQLIKNERLNYGDYFDLSTMEMVKKTQSHLSKVSDSTTNDKQS